MLFIHPMWDSEAQRIGKQQCTPTGYTIHVVAERIGFAGLLLLLGLGVFFLWPGVAENFRASYLWLLLAPFSLDLVSDVLMRYSWRLANRKGFHYDYDSREASWYEDGERRSYKFPH